jgi:hypothetical protein
LTAFVLPFRVFASADEMLLLFPVLAPLDGPSSASSLEALFKLTLGALFVFADCMVLPSSGTLGDASHPFLCWTLLLLTETVACASGA